MSEIIYWSLIIFVARIVDVSLGTIRINMIVRRKKILAATIGFFEVAIFISIIVRIVQQVDSIYGILAYAAGFAVGTIIGVIISEKLSRDLISTNIISKKHSDEIKEVLKEEGYGITFYNGKGINGEVEIINVVCSQLNAKRMNKLVYNTDPKAFTASYMLDRIRGGFMKGLKKK
ncbi:DUF2179 domain-containing protein [Actinomycetota bacterium]